MWKTLLVVLLIFWALWAAQTRGADIVFISSMDPGHMPGDDTLKAYMEGLGYTVEYLDDDATQQETEAAAIGADLLFISESCSSQRIRTEVSQIPVPMIITESWVWDEMGLTCGEGGGQEAAGTAIQIVAPDHPLAAGLAGSVRVFAATSGRRGPARFGKGIAGADATVIARARGTDGLTYDVVFIYEKGAALPVVPADGSPPVAAGIRICLGFDEQSYLLWNENAYALFGAAIQYVLGQRPDPRGARVPSPPHQAVDVARDVVLSWRPGPVAGTHDVYLGTSFEDVNEASKGDPRGVLVSQAQDPNCIDPPGLLRYSTTYYWRVDEVNAAVEPTVIKGPVWSFTTEPYAYPFRQAITATASGSAPGGCGPERTVDRSGLDDQDRHGTHADTMWLSNAMPAWIQYDLGDVYKLDRMWVWNSNSVVETAMGLGARDVTIEVCAGGTDWQAIGQMVRFNQATGRPDYAPNTQIDLGGALARYVRLTIHNNWGGVTPYVGLSEVRFFHVPVRAYDPRPGPGTTGIHPAAVLEWRPGREAAVHRVYLASDLAAVKAGTAASFVTEEHRIDLARWQIGYATRYYWRVDEVNQAAAVQVWTGQPWSFTTVHYLLVEGFESYDDQCNRIFYVWRDGYGYSDSPQCGVFRYAGNGSGSAVGNLAAPFAERTIVHSGLQSMPMEYDNSQPPYYSEAQRTFVPVQDWAVEGLDTLSLFVWHTARSGQQAPESIYLAVEDGLGRQYTATNTDLLSRAEGRWVQWDIPMAAIAASGLDTNRIIRLRIGVGNRSGTLPGGSGKVYVDDIMLRGADGGSP